ncbi:MAG TPA: chemotaxis protein CheB [Saprospiraceae bacterium]|nr:chemotaxis protein CheB [Saprospiraceae bacterium]
MAKHPKFIAVIGASAGGLNALAEMVRTFQKGQNIAYCIVLHLSRKGIGDYVVHRLKQSTDLNCSLAVDNGAIERDHIYIARPNQHMLVKDNRIILGNGPEENRFRPSIDVLFRSAAVAYGSNAIGIILSGLLDDGTSGMWAIKRSEGISIVQDPNQAEYPDMPLSIINNMEVDYVLPLSEIGQQVFDIVNQPGRIKKDAPPDVLSESSIAETVAVGIAKVEEIGKISVFACPDCGGNLWSIDHDIIPRYRCHIGHAYTEKDLIIKQAQHASATLWIALRIMEERKHLLNKMKVTYENKGFKSLSVSNAKKEADIEIHIDRLKKILSDLQTQ